METLLEIIKNYLAMAEKAPKDGVQVTLKRLTVPEFLEKLKKDNKDEVNCPVKKDLNYYINIIAEKKGWKFEKTDRWLTEVFNVCPSAALKMILREIAIDLDLHYEGHIKNSEKIYCINILDGKITELQKHKIKSYKHFAAFRNIEDAKFACSVVSGLLRSMYK